MTAPTAAASHSAERSALAYHEAPCQEHRNAVVFATEPIIRSIIAKISRPADVLAQPDELFNVGVVATLQALDQFDPQANCRFITFAYPRIRGEIIDFLRRLDPLSRRCRAKVAKERSVCDRLSQRMGHAPTEQDVATEMQVSVDQLHTIRRDAMQRFQDSLDHVQDAESGLRLVDIVPDAGATVAFDRMEWEDIRRHLDGCCRALDQRERTILELYFGEDMTLAEIGALLGVSEARISQLRRAALQRLSATIDSDLRRAA